jgi:hypothetical protein
LVNNCDFARHYDFKRSFEDLRRAQSRNLAAFYLTPTNTMLINHALNKEGERARKIQAERFSKG